MSIPASIAISKLRYPEIDEPLTKGKITVSRDKSNAQNGLHAFSNGAWFGLRVAGLILCNVLTIIALVHVIDGVLTYIGRSFLIDEGRNRGPLTLELIFSYLFYPLAWLMGVPKPDLITVARLLGIKFTQNEFVRSRIYPPPSRDVARLTCSESTGRIPRARYPAGNYDHTWLQHRGICPLRIRQSRFSWYSDRCIVCSGSCQEGYYRQSCGLCPCMWLFGNMPNCR